MTREYPLHRRHFFPFRCEGRLASRKGTLGNRQGCSLGLPPEAAESSEPVPTGFDSFEQTDIAHSFEPVDGSHGFLMRPVARRQNE